MKAGHCSENKESCNVEEGPRTEGSEDTVRADGADLKNEFGLQQSLAYLEGGGSLQIDGLVHDGLIDDEAAQHLSTNRSKWGSLGSASNKTAPWKPNHTAPRNQTHGHEWAERSHKRSSIRRPSPMLFRTSVTEAIREPGLAVRRFGR